MGYSDYMQTAQRGSINPKDEFTHKKYILENEPELVGKFNQIVDAQLRLANIQDQKQLNLERLQIFNLLELFQMKLRDPALSPVFFFCYYAWKGGLGLTRAVKGRERGLQALVGTTSPESEGFGAVAGINSDTEESQFFSKLAGWRPRPKGEFRE